MKTKIEEPCCGCAKVVLTDEDLEKVDLTNAVKELLDRMIFDECEKVRHKLTRKLFRIHPNYVQMDVIKCAGQKFCTNVYNRTIHNIALKKLTGKRYFNVKRLIRRAIIEEILLSFGK